MASSLLAISPQPIHFNPIDTPQTASVASEHTIHVMVKAVSFSLAQCVNISPKATIGDLRRAIGDKVGSPPAFLARENKQALRAKDQQTLEEIGLTEDCILYDLGDFGGAC